MAATKAKQYSLAQLVEEATVSELPQILLLANRLETDEKRRIKLYHQAFCKPMSNEEAGVILGKLTGCEVAELASTLKDFPEIAIYLDVALPIWRERRSGMELVREMLKQIEEENVICDIVAADNIQSLLRKYLADASVANLTLSLPPYKALAFAGAIVEHMGLSGDLNAYLDNVIFAGSPVATGIDNWVISQNDGFSESTYLTIVSAMARNLKPAPNAPSQA